jgi:transcription initiation factor TFIIIB Brf1 subunit/transcription initiation factor TFIIB
MFEETKSLSLPTVPCPHCGSGEFILWQGLEDCNKGAISCNGCGAVLSSTHPLDDDDRPRRRPRPQRAPIADA